MRSLPGFIAFIFAVSCILAFFVSKLVTISLLQLIFMYFGYLVASQLPTFIRWFEAFEWRRTIWRLVAITTATYSIFALGYAFGATNAEEPNIVDGLSLFSLPFLLVLAFEFWGYPLDPTS